MEMKRWNRNNQLVWKRKNHLSVTASDVAMPGLSWNVVSDIAFSQKVSFTFGSFGHLSDRMLFHSNLG